MVLGFTFEPGLTGRLRMYEKIDEEIRKLKSDSISTALRLQERSLSEELRESEPIDYATFESALKRVTLVERLDSNYGINTLNLSSQPSDDRKLRQLEIQIDNLEGKLDAVVQQIIEYNPTGANEAAMKIKFIIRIIYTTPGVEMDYFLFEIDSAANSILS